MLYKKYILLLLFLGILSNISAQYRDASEIRNFNHSLILSGINGKIEKIQFSEFGELRSRINSNARFLYQGQEFEPFLGLYFFQSRLYQPLLKRFFQPDPYSQYFSVYLFVGSDPINYIDADGQFGKPLILYEEIQKEGGSISDTTQDFLDEAVDSYQYSLGDFMNGKIGKLPDWNGNVFIKAHMSVEKAHNLELEQVHGNLASNIESDKLKYFWNKEGKFTTVEIDSKEFGRQLRYFAEYQETPIENIVSGGCQGSATGHLIGQGYAERPAIESDFPIPKSGKLGVTVFGLKEGYMGFYVGEAVTRPEESGALPLERSRFYAVPENAPIQETYERIGDGEERVSGYAIDHGHNIRESLDYAEGEELQDFADARIPNVLNPVIEDFHIPY